MIDPHGRPRGILYSERLAVPAALADRLWTGDGYSDRLVYAHALSLQTHRRIVAGLFHLGLTDPSSEAFGRALWWVGVKTHCRRCHCDILAWSERSMFCGQRCRNLWLISHPQDVAAGALIVGARELVRAGVRRVRG